MTDRSSTLLRRVSSKRSVPSMKSLLPLKLLSPTLPQPHIWPSASQDQRSTFGVIQPTQESSKVQGKTNNPLGLRLSVLPPRQSQRDTPIYNELGSPLPERAYYTSDDICNCSQPASSFNDRCVFHDHTAADNVEPEYEDDEVASQSNTIDATNFRRRSYDAPRSSDLSFQCSGEDPVPSEAAWLSTPLPDSPKSRLTRRRSGVRTPVERSVNTWLSDTASELGENVVACATAVSPRKAQVVNVNRFSDESYPPRGSSLNAPSSATLPVERYSWASSDDSPPDTPTRELEFDDNRSVCDEPEPQWIFPRRRLDLAMNSPPMSPKVFPDPPPASRFSYSAMSAGIEVDEDPNPVSRWSFDSTMSEDKSTVHIITDLEDMVSGFPRNMLLPDTPCISEIRLGLSNTSSDLPSPTISHSSSESRSNDSHSIANFSRPRRTNNNLTSSRSTPIVQNNPAWRSSFISSSSTIQPATRLSKPDLTPLSRIFPNSSEYTRLALYGHILAHIFLTSLPSTPSPQLENNNNSSSSNIPRRRRDTPYWTTSHAGHPRMSDSYPSFAPTSFASTSSNNESSTLQLRIQTLRSKLRKCIFRLMNNMDSSICQANLDGRAELMLRAVEEVVGATEKLACCGSC
ncbi:hypothetical protein ONS95_001359 [Cadophora gregata]|uniref:uncharacterized protein n=1 Tax=Cadophora gregata TaxID=51156 RepID=UPI0026DAFD10|nr:uncharacterized protein ONS95_001359 [Cadophora gregata]KAK0110978.1 hypothetical protein ONS95_001359 [Cadophora gregata]